jgi:hypothetical protein
MLNETLMLAVANGSTLPITLTSSATTNWPQFVITLIISGGLIFWMIGGSLLESLNTVKTYVLGLRFKRMSKRPLLIVRHNTQGLFSFSMIGQETLTKIMQALNKLGGKSFDLLLHTPGGQVFHTLLISKLLKQHSGTIRAVVPSYAMSGGTILALTCNELWMGSTAVVGPTDPQLGSFFKSASAKGWNKVVKFKKTKANDDSIVFDMEGQQYTKLIRQHLGEHLRVGCVNDKARSNLINYLTNGDIGHAQPLTREDLTRMGLKVGLLSEKESRLLGEIANIKGGSEVLLIK